MPIGLQSNSAVIRLPAQRNPNRLPGGVTMVVTRSPGISKSSKLHSRLHTGFTAPIWMGMAGWMCWVLHMGMMRWPGGAMVVAHQSYGNGRISTHNFRIAEDRVITGCILCCIMGNPQSYRPAVISAVYPSTIRPRIQRFAEEPACVPPPKLRSLLNSGKKLLTSHGLTPSSHYSVRRTAAHRLPCVSAIYRNMHRTRTAASPAD